MSKTLQSKLNLKEGEMVTLKFDECNFYVDGEGSNHPGLIGRGWVYLGNEEGCGEEFVQPGGFGEDYLYAKEVAQDKKIIRVSGDVTIARDPWGARRSCHDSRVIRLLVQNGFEISPVRSGGTL